MSEVLHNVTLRSIDPYKISFVSSSYPAGRDVLRPHFNSIREDILNRLMDATGTFDGDTWNWDQEVDLVDDRSTPMFRMNARIELESDSTPEQRKLRDPANCDHC